MIRHAVCLACLAAPAVAQDTGPCAPRTEIVAGIAGAGETLQSMGMTDVGVLEIYASAETGTWIVLSSRTDGTSCVVAIGTAFAHVIPFGGPF